MNIYIYIYMYVHTCVSVYVHRYICIAKAAATVSCIRQIRLNATLVAILAYIVAERLQQGLSVSVESQGALL